MGIIEKDMHGMRAEIQKVEAYKSYGDSESRIEIKSPVGRYAFVRVLKGEAPKGYVCIHGGFLYHGTQVLARRSYRTVSYIDNDSRLYARFRAKCPQEDVGANSAALTEQLQRLGVILSIIAARNRILE